MENVSTYCFKKRKKESLKSEGTHNSLGLHCMPGITVTCMVKANLITCMEKTNLIKYRKDETQ